MNDERRSTAETRMPPTSDPSRFTVLSHEDDPLLHPDEGDGFFCPTSHETTDEARRAVSGVSA